MVWRTQTQNRVMWCTASWCQGKWVSKTFQNGIKAALLSVCLSQCELWLKRYLSEDEEEIRWERRRPCVRARVPVQDREIAQDLAVAAVWGWLLSISHLVWLKSTHKHTCAFGRRCAHTANSSSKALTAGWSWSLPAARGNMDKPAVAAGQLDTLWVQTCMHKCLCAPLPRTCLVKFLAPSPYWLLPVRAHYCSVFQWAVEERRRKVSNPWFLLCIAVRLQLLARSQVCRCHTHIAIWYPCLVV